MKSQNDANYLTSTRLPKFYGGQARYIQKWGHFFYNNISPTAKFRVADKLL